MKKIFDTVLIYLFSALLLIEIGIATTLFFLPKSDILNAVRIAMVVGVLGLIVGMIGINRTVNESIKSFEEIVKANQTKNN